MRRCPVCSSLIEETWETTGQINCGWWWTGRYSCPNCGQFRASGTERDGIRRIVQWSPGCPVHGCDPVHLVGVDNAGDDDEWCCSECSRRFRHLGGKIVTTWQPFDRRYQPVFLEAATMRGTDMRTRAALMVLLNQERRSSEVM